MMKTYKPFCEPQDEFELRLMRNESLYQDNEITYIEPPGKCDLCEAPFENKRYMIDACLEENRNPWGCVCAKCYFKYNLEIGWGKGQLYYHVNNGEWLLIAGY